MKPTVWYLSFQVLCLAVIRQVVSVTPEDQKTMQEMMTFKPEEAVNLINPKVDEKVKIFMYTPEHQDEVEVKAGDKESLKEGGFIPKNHVVVCSHGFLNNRTSPACADIKDALLSKGGITVFVIDWGLFAQREKYPVAAGRVGAVGKHVAPFIDFIVGEGVKPKKITLVGHSLGCHIVGNIGRNVKEKVGLAVGLDCAGPGFTGVPPGPYAGLMIRKSDAHLVETWISNALVYGISHGVGHITCYLNNGSDQPGCAQEYSDNPVMSAVCSHGRAPLIWAESIKTGGAPAKLCKNEGQVKQQNCNGRKGLMGDYHQKSKPGTYLMITNSAAPFIKK